MRITAQRSDGATRLTGSRKAAPKMEEIKDAYQKFISERQLHGTPTAAHQFALFMLFKGVALDLSVRELVLELEGELPAYWDN
jgi:hypothetical protein